MSAPIQMAPPGSSSYVWTPHQAQGLGEGDTCWHYVPTNTNTPLPNYVRVTVKSALTPVKFAGSLPGSDYSLLVEWPGGYLVETYLGHISHEGIRKAKT